MSPDAVWIFTLPEISWTRVSPLALLMLTPPSTRFASTSPDAVETLRPPSVPRATTSADFERTESVEERGQRIRQVIPWRVKPSEKLKPPRLFGTSTIRWPSFSSMRASSTSRCDSSSCAVNSTSMWSSSVGSTTISPDASRTSIWAGPLISNVFCTFPLLPLRNSALAVAAKALAADVHGARFGGPRDCPHEPRIGRDALAICGLLDRDLERLREAQADPRRELFARRR